MDLEFVGKPNLIPIWNEYFIQTNTYAILWRDSKRNVIWRGVSKPKFGDRSSQPSFLEFLLDEDSYTDLAQWHDGVDRSERWVSFYYDAVFAILVGMLLAKRGVKYPAFKAFWCFFGVRWGWWHRFDGTPPPEAYAELQAQIDAGNVSKEFQHLIP